MLKYYILIPIFTLTAWVYASVGLGGGTAYLSVMSLCNSDPAVLRPIAWSLNIVAAGVCFVNFQRQGHFNARLAWPFLAGGIVGAALGGHVAIGQEVFQALLAITLVAAALRMLFGKDHAEVDTNARAPVVPSLALGAVVGLLSGLVGIGGGIVLGPVLVGLRWVDMKTLAPITALYILLNSAAALISFLIAGGSVDLPLTGVLSVAVLIGGFAGSRWGARKASESTLKRIFGLVALAAGIKLACEFSCLIGS